MSERLTTPEEAVCFKLGVALTMERIVLEMLVAFEERAQREEVKHVLRRPADEARLHLARVEKSFQLLGAESECSACPAMSGLQLQAQATLARADESLFDVVILAGAVEAEHYEIGVYETLVPSTEALGASMAAHLLEENVEEERAALEAFKALAKRIVREGSTFSV